MSKRVSYQSYYNINSESDIPRSTKCTRKKRHQSPLTPSESKQTYCEPSVSTILYII